MTKIETTNVVSLLYQKYNKEFKELNDKKNILEARILDLEIKISEMNREKFNIERSIELIEKHIVETLFR